MDLYFVVGQRHKTSVGMSIMLQGSVIASRVPWPTRGTQPYVKKKVRFGCMTA